MIGGVSTDILGRKTPDEVEDHVEEVIGQCMDYRGFALSCGGGLSGNIPLENLERYFDVRARYGFTPENWRSQN